MRRIMKSLTQQETANVDHFIRTMPDGYEMEINTEGDNVSLGQKQLLTIARAVVSDLENLET